MALGYLMADAEILDFRRSQIKLVDKSESATPQEDALKSNIKNLYHKKDGTWEYKKMQNGHTLRFSAPTKEKALEKLRNIKNLEKAKVVTEKATTFDTWVDTWFKLYKEDNIKQNTYKRYEQMTRLHIKPFFKNIPIKKITAEKVQQFLKQIKGERNREYAYITIKQILKYAYINRKISENIADFIVKPKKARSEHRTGLSLEEQENLLRKLKEFDMDTQMFVMFSLILGTRRSETVEFKLSDINRIKNTVHIHGTKTYDSDRKIKISDAMIDLLFKSKTKSENERYFDHTNFYYTHQVKYVYETAGIKNKSLHDLRHTCSTNLFYLGVPDKQRQQILGHTNIAMTNDVYTNLQEDISKDGLLKLYNNLYFDFS